MSPAEPRLPPLIVHVLYRFSVGGLESGVANLVNHLDPLRFRHRIVALTDVVPAFASRLLAGDIQCVALAKPPGSLVPLYPRLYRLFRAWSPAVIHTRNLAALEAAIPAWAAGIPVRIHGEHGRDLADLLGTRRKYQRIRRLYSPFVHRWIALSKDLERYLVERVGIDAGRVEQIYNGVDTTIFRPATAFTPHPESPFESEPVWVVGTVGRLQAVKNQTLLARAFVRMCARSACAAHGARLVIAGEGPLAPEIRSIMGEAGLADRVWLPGERHDIARVLRGMHCFVLPSLAEGVSNTLLEAMATGLPVIATDVGGNAELVVQDRTGTLVTSGDADSMADAMIRYFESPNLARRHGMAGRDRVCERFSLNRMVTDYQTLYSRMLNAQVDRDSVASTERAPG